MASKGTDISASLSGSSSSATGAIKFGNVSIGGVANNTLYLVGGLVLAGVAVWYFFIRKK